MARRDDTGPLTVALGQAIRELRGKQGMTQDALGLRCGIHSTWISHIESGRVNPTIGNVARIADGLGLSLSELMKKTEGIVELSNVPKPLEAEIRWRPKEETKNGIDQG